MNKILLSTNVSISNVSESMQLTCVSVKMLAHTKQILLNFSMQKHFNLIENIRQCFRSTRSHLTRLSAVLCNIHDQRIGANSSCAVRFSTMLIQTYAKAILFESLIFREGQVARKIRHLMRYKR